MSQNQTTSPSGLVALSCTLPIICIFAICLRFWLRNRQKSPLRADDWLMLPALVSEIPVFKPSQSGRLLKTAASFFLLACALAAYWVGQYSAGKTIRNAYHQPAGVRRKVWGYPTPDPDHGITDYNNNVSYESKVSPYPRPYPRPYHSSRSTHPLSLPFPAPGGISIYTNPHTRNN